ncbi:MAG: T9SS type A sorting domain-containing protein, partial [Bacteroidales bacterium]|nr:T9SS type A sorting domain-containing protein [Bacteroidales bacterium]
YTVSAYFRIDKNYADLHQNGNFLWNFSNSANAATDQNGYLIGSLSRQSNSITPGYYTEASGNQAVSFPKAALKGSWHHLAYTQNGSTGTLYIDGVPMAASSITNTPASALIKSGLSGTPYNWIGRSCYQSDVYLRNTLVYDFRVYRRALTSEEILTSELDVERNIARLERAIQGYEGEGKTADSQPHEPLLRPKASLLLVNLTDETNQGVELQEITDISFSEGTIHINLTNGDVRSFTFETVKSMLFTSHPTNLTKSPVIHELVVFPNPATDYIYFEALPDNRSPIDIYSINGHLVMTEIIHPQQMAINISSLPKGLYILKTGRHTIKFQKK